MTRDEFFKLIEYEPRRFRWIEPDTTNRLTAALLEDREILAKADGFDVMLCAVAKGYDGKVSFKRFGVGIDGDLGVITPYWISHLQLIK